MCKWGTTVNVWVKIPADLSYTEKERWDWKGIDSCIAPIVSALQKGGIDMRGSCCGHSKWMGQIALQDGRVLLIGNNDYFHKPVRFFLKMAYRSLILKKRATWVIQWIKER